jgi:hypothetical protein
MSRVQTLILLMGFLAGDVCAQVSALDREMLLSFYQSTNGPRWLQSTGWNGPPGTECTWYGVTCAQGAVTGLQLPDNNLGELDATHPFAFLLPVEPVNLRALTFLNLAGQCHDAAVAVPGSQPVHRSVAGGLEQPDPIAQSRADRQCAQRSLARVVECDA